MFVAESSKWNSESGEQKGFPIKSKCFFCNQIQPPLDAHIFCCVYISAPSLRRGASSFCKWACYTAFKTCMTKQQEREFFLCKFNWVVPFSPLKKRTLTEARTTSKAAWMTNRLEKSLREPLLLFLVHRLKSKCIDILEKRGSMRTQNRLCCACTCLSEEIQVMKLATMDHLWPSDFGPCLAEISFKHYPHTFPCLSENYKNTLN